MFKLINENSATFVAEFSFPKKFRLLIFVKMRLFFFCSKT